MNNPLMDAAFPQADMFGFSRLLQQAIQNPEQSAQIFAMMGIQPPDLSMIGNGPSVNPFADVSGVVQATPQERVSQGFESLMPPQPQPLDGPQMPQQAVELGSDANPFPTPVAGANPFPTPFGTPRQSGAGGSQFDPKALANMLRGVSVPSAPEPQKVSSPNPPQARSIDQNSQIVAMLTKMLSGQKDPVSMLRLGQALNLGGR